MAKYCILNYGETWERFDADSDAQAVSIFAGEVRRSADLHSEPFAETVRAWKLLEIRDVDTSAAEAAAPSCLVPR